MARKTLSGAPSSKSDKCTCIRPSRKRMVVFRLVKRRKRTSRTGIGARGRRARYSSANSKCNSGFTAFQPSRTLHPEPSPFLFFLLPFLFFFFLVGDVFFFVSQHLYGRLVGTLVGINGRLAQKIVLGAGLWLVQNFRPFVGLGNDFFQDLAQIGVLFVVLVHVVLKIVGEACELVEKIVDARGLVLRDGIRIEGMDLLGAVVHVAHK